LLHRFLGIGVTTMAAIFVMLTYTGTAPLLPKGDDGAAMIAYALTGIVALLLTVAMVFLRPRVPERRLDQSVQAYWATIENASAALLVWFVLEGASILAAIGFLLTGHLAPAVAMLVGITVFWLNGPETFARP
jgi:hypothetical protein